MWFVWYNIVWWCFNRLGINGWENDWLIVIENIVKFKKVFWLKVLKYKCINF